MSIADELNKNIADLAASYVKTADAGATQPTQKNFDNLPATIAGIDSAVASGIPPLSMNSVSDYPARDYKVYGDSFQQTYSGKQLIMEQGFATPGDDTSFWFADVSSFLTPQEDGWAHFEFENTGSSVVNRNMFIKLSNVLNIETSSQYTMFIEIRNVAGAPNFMRGSQGNASEAFQTGWIFYPTTTSINSQTLTTKSSFNGVSYGVRIYAGCPANATTSFDIRVSLYPGTVDPDDFSYEPYVGGIPSPNPDYPQEIESVGDLITEGENAGKYSIPITVSGKNILEIRNIQRTINGITFTPNSDGSITISGTSTGDATYPLNVNSSTNARSVVLTANTEYEISWLPRGNKYYLQVYYVENGKTVYRGGTGSPVFTPTQDVLLGAYFRVESGVTINTTVYPMIRAVATSTPEFEPYHDPVTTNIILDEPLRKLGDYADYIDYKNQSVVRNIAEIASYNGETISGSYMSTTGSLTTGATVDYSLTTPITTSVSLPSLERFAGSPVTVSVGTSTQPSNMWVKF